MTKPGFEPRNIEMEVRCSIHFTIRTPKKYIFATNFRVVLNTVISGDIHCVRHRPIPHFCRDASEELP